MKGKFEKGDIVELRHGVRMTFKFPSRRGIVQFAYDHEPRAYEVEFYWCGSSLGRIYLAEEELEALIIPWAT
jgi:hypothetical protein